MNGENLLGQAQDVVRRALAAGADQAEAYMEQGADAFVELENGKLAFTGSTQSRGGAVRVVQGGRQGFAYFTDASAAEGAITQALRLARLAPDKEFALPFVHGSTRIGNRWDDQVAALDVDRAAALARDLVAGASEACPEAVTAGGGVSLAWGMEAIASSEGVACWDRATMVSAGTSLVLEEGKRSLSHWNSDVSHHDALDAHQVAAHCAKTLASLRGAKAADAGAMDIVFQPEAVSELLSGLVVAAAVGDDAMRGKTAWSKRLGQDVADVGLTIADDPLHPEAVGASPFDGEGMAVQRLPFVADGKLTTYLFDSVDAHEHGTQTTRSAVRGSFKDRPTTGVHHLTATCKDTRPFEALVSDVDDGYLVGSVLGAHTANVTTGDFSVTAPNVWRIQGGTITGAASEIALAGNLLDLLHRVDGASKEMRRMTGARLPALRFRDVRVST